MNFNVFAVSRNQQVGNALSCPLMFVKAGLRKVLRPIEHKKMRMLMAINAPGDLIGPTRKEIRGVKLKRTKNK